MQPELGKKILPFVQSLSLKTLASILAGTFLLSTVLSMVAAYVLMPTNAKPKRQGSKRESVLPKDIGLSKEDQKIILDRNIFNSEGVLGDAVVDMEPGKKGLWEHL